jgi:hypothetical protein
VNYKRASELSRELGQLEKEGLWGALGRMGQGIGNMAASAGKGTLGAVQWGGNNKPLGMALVGGLGALGAYSWAKKPSDSKARNIVDQFGAQGPPNTSMMS